MVRSGQRLRRARIYVDRETGKALRDVLRRQRHDACGRQRGRCKDDGWEQSLDDLKCLLSRQKAATRSTSQKLAKPPIAYGAMRQTHAGCDQRSRCAARQPTAIRVNTAPTNSNCPISTPTLKNSKAIG